MCWLKVCYNESLGPVLISIAVFEARNLLQARIRKKESDRANAPMKRAQSLLMDVTSPNLMNFADTTDPYHPTNIYRG